MAMPRISRQGLEWRTKNIFFEKLYYGKGRKISENCMRIKRMRCVREEPIWCCFFPAKVGFQKRNDHHLFLQSCGDGLEINSLNCGWWCVVPDVQSWRSDQVYDSYLSSYRFMINEKWVSEEICLLRREPVSVSWTNHSLKYSLQIFGSGNRL